MSNDNFSTSNATPLSNFSEMSEYSLEALHTFYDNADIGIYVTDYYTGEILMCNNTYTSAFGITTGEMTGRYCFHNMGYESRCVYCPYDKLLDENGEPLGVYNWENYIEKFGIWVKCTNRAIRWIDKRLVHIATFIDITQRRQKEEDLNLLAFQDRILEIPNALRLEHDLKSDSLHGYLVVLGIHDLGKINGAYGRDGGDSLLRMIRDYIIEARIPNSTLYRLEIGNFGILLKNTEDNDELTREVVEILHNRFGSGWTISIGEQLQTIFTSVNICVMPLGYKGTSFNHMYGAIEHTLDIARKTGGVAIYDDDIHEKFHYETRLEFLLKKATRENMAGFHLAYQPLVEPGVATWSGIEVLCRWDSAELGPVSPGQFIPIAESSGLISTIGLWVLEQSILQIKTWGLDRIERFLLDVNLSPAQLAFPNLDQLIVKLLEKYDYPPERLCLEVTESNEMNFSRHNMEVIERLSAIGVVIALDDFGTGYSSFNTLHKLPVKLLKTDQSFIAGMESDSHLQHLFYVMVELAHGSNMKIVVEGVETEPQAKALLLQGADYFQGYFFSYPLSPEQMEKKLHQFYTPSKLLASMEYARLDLSILQDDIQGYNLTPALNKTLNRCTHELFSNPDSHTAINTSLAYIGEILRVSNAYVFLKESDGTYSNTNEWRTQGMQSKKTTLQHIPVAQICPQLLDTLKSDGILVASDVRMLDKGEYGKLNIQGIKSAVGFPIWKDSELYGFVGLVDCNTVHSWMREEVQMLYALTNIITATLGKMWLQNEITAQTKRQENVLNNIDTAIYVSDLNTNEILFANSSLIRLYGNQPLTGRICWEALHNRSERCEFCPLPHLLEHPAEGFQWEYYNKDFGRHFRVRNSIIPWTGNEPVHLGYSEDITELRESERALEIFASTDMGTFTLTRSAFENTVSKLLNSARISCTPVTIAFIDIDSLKKINNVYGHQAGDELINNMLKAVRAGIRENDLIGRYVGDKFVIAFSQCTKKNAEKRVLDITRLFDNLTKKQSSYPTSRFSYGIVENTEIPYTIDYYKRLIEIADKRMREQKKQKNFK